MARAKGCEKTPGSGRKQGTKNRQTVAVEKVVQAFTDYINEHSEKILDDLMESNPGALATFLAKVAPKKLEHTGDVAPYVVVKLPEQEKDRPGN